VIKPLTSTGLSAAAGDAARKNSRKYERSVAESERTKTGCGGAFTGRSCCITLLETNI
jgi:hypothetical protein